MPRKKDPNKPAVLYPALMTNGQVEELREGGFEPVVRWVKKKDLHRDNPRAWRTRDALRAVRAMVLPGGDK